MYIRLVWSALVLTRNINIGRKIQKNGRCRFVKFGYYTGFEEKAFIFSYTLFLEGY